MNLQLVGSYIDSIIPLAIGLAGVLFPHKLVRAGTEEERHKKIKVVRIASIVVTAAALGMALIKHA